MIFQHTFENVINESKTQTRRVINSSDVAIRGRYNQIKAVNTNNRAKWVVDRTYSVQTGRGQRSIARIQITRINSQAVKYISTADAIAEGFNSRADFIQTWKSIHGEQSLDKRVWIIEFKLVGLEAENYPTMQLVKIVNR